MHTHSHDGHSHDGHSHDGHSHDGHSHGHSYAPANYNVAFAIGIGLNLAFVVVEAAFGFWADSLALLADAAHNLSDVAGLVLAWGAAWLGQRRPTARRSYGYRRASILAAVANATLLLVAVGGILVESVKRLGTPEPFASTTVIWVASVAIVINGVTALMFMRGRQTDLNIRGAFLHLAGDAAVSLGVVVTALIAERTGWLWLDPAAGIAISLVILYSAWGLGRDSFNLAFDGTPAGIDPEAVKGYLAGLPDVVDVHDLHIWAMSTTETALTAHLVRPGTGLDDALLARACAELDKQFGIRHATLQIESGDPAHPCRLAPAEVV
jgi:cobalt-zinc-cadmium efflux system protein